MIIKKGWCDASQCHDIRQLEKELDRYLEKTFNKDVIQQVEILDEMGGFVSAKPVPTFVKKL